MRQFSIVYRTYVSFCLIIWNLRSYFKVFPSAPRVKSTSIGKTLASFSTANEFSWYSVTAATNRCSWKTISCTMEMTRKKQYIDIRCIWASKYWLESCFGLHLGVKTHASLSVLVKVCKLEIPQRFYKLKQTRTVKPCWNLPIREDFALFPDILLMLP